MNHVSPLLFFLDLLYPPRCGACNRLLTSGMPNQICPRCMQAIQLIYPPFCKKCGVPIPNNIKYKELCGRCKKGGHSFDRIWSCTVYEGVMARIIRQYKYHKKRLLSHDLVQLMIRFAEMHIPMKDVDVVLAVPLHRKKEYARTFNQAEYIARPFAQYFNKIYCRDVLRKVRYTESQSMLTKSERTRNVTASFRLYNRHNVAQRHILLVDDVLTTGATINECAKILIAGGAKKVSAFVVSRGI
ncbi:MAG: ComF family protein [Candidatus Omnitrophica bacterium]|nr:ComF family protein [Candidatus Omnitrophota bacterium]